MSKIRYGLPLYGIVKQTTIDESGQIMGDIQKLVNKVMRMITRTTLGDRKSIPHLIKESGIQGVNSMCAQSILLEMKRGLSSDIPFITESLKEAGEHLCQTRAASRGDLNSFLAHSKKEKQSFLFQGQTLWNQLPENIRHLKSHHQFKNCVKIFSHSLPV